MKGLLWVEGAPGVSRSLWLGGARRRRPHDALQRLLAMVPADTPAMGAGDLVSRLEGRIAGLLGKEAAVLLPTGKMAQQIATRIHADETGRPSFAAHPACHLVNWELDGYSVVHGLSYQALGTRDRLFGASDITALDTAVGTVVWELPQRDLGGRLPSWEELGQQVGTARGAGSRTHLDGARLWEAETAYSQSYTEIAELFDSVYVSLYKTLEAPRGAVLAGGASFIGQARSWSIRLGGDSSGNWPIAAAGLVALDDIVPRMPRYRDHARSLAAAISATGVAKVVPDPPSTPLFHVSIPVAPEAAARAHVGLSGETGLEIFRSLRTSDDPGSCAFEISVGESATEIPPAEVAGFITALVERASEEDESIGVGAETEGNC